VSHHFFEVLYSLPPNQLGQRKHDRISLGLETEQVPRFLDERIGQIQSSAHTINVESYAVRCQDWSGLRTSSLRATRSPRRVKVEP